MKIQAIGTLLLSCLVLKTASGGPLVRTVALTGQPAPGNSVGTVFNRVAGPALNEQGQVSFSATLAGGGTTTLSDSSMWTEAGGTLTMILREGMAAPGLEPGVMFSEQFGLPGLADNGSSVFRGYTRGSSDSEADDGIWRYANGTLSQIVRQNRQAPGFPAGVIVDWIIDWFPGQADNGAVAFIGGVSGPGINARNSMVIWIQNSGPVTPVFQSGTQAPGFPARVTVSAPTGFNPIQAVNASGEIAFQANLSGPGITPATQDSLWSTSGGGLHLEVRSGDPAPGLPPGNAFDGFFAYPSVFFDNAGDIGFHGGTTGFVEGVWSSRGGLHAVARSGEPAPGVPGAIFDGFNTLAMNGAGRMAFIAGIHPGDPADWTPSVWSEGSGSLTLVARAGEQAPGAPAGFTFSSFGPGTLNNLGQYAFQAGLSNGTQPGGHGVWVHDLDGMVRLIVRTGDTIEVGPGDFRTVTQVFTYGETGNEGGLPSLFNNRGQFAFHARFTDGSQGVFVTDIVAVPEPGFLAMIVPLSVAALSRRRR